MRLGVMMNMMIAKIATGLAVVTSLAACGTQQASTADTAEVQVSVESSEVRSDASTLFYSWYGTDEDRAAAEVIVAHEVNAAAAECMTDKGYPLDWTQAIQNAAPVDPLGPSIWTNEPMGRIFSNPYLAATDAMHAEQEMNAGEADQGRADASNECRKQHPGASDRQVDAIRHPDGQEKLLEAWRDGLRSATSEFGTYGDYQKCMSSQQVPLLGDQAVTAENFYAKLRTQAPTADDLPSTKSPEGSTKWQEFLNLENQWLNADWACRADVYDRAMVRVPEFLDTFAHQHAEEIAQLQNSWHLISLEAASLT